MRTELTVTAIESALEECTKKLFWRLKQKGRWCFVSNHEIFGVIVQETSEYETAIHERISPDAKIEELYDIAVAALLGAASIKSNGCDW